MNNDSSKAFAQIAISRRSVRAFTNRPVARNLMERIFALANQAPSNCNTQPWLVHVVSGTKREQLATRIAKSFMSGNLQPDFPYEGKYNGIFKDRQYGAAAALYTAAGIERQDKTGRAHQFAENFRFFGAPHVAFVFMPEEFGIREACDIGMYAQTLMLAMTANGVACCPQTALSFCAADVREELNIPDSQKLLFGISFGYKDIDNAVNSALTDRCALEEIVTFYE